MSNSKKNNNNNVNSQPMAGLLYKVLDKNPSAIAWKDKNFCYMGANKAFLNYCQLPLEQFIGKTNEEIGWLDENELRYIQDDTAVLRGESVTYNGIKLKLRDEYKYFIINKSPLVDDDGNIIGILTVMDDVTTENILQKQLSQLNSILDNISVGVCLYRKITREDAEEFKGVSINLKLREMLDITTDDFINNADGKDIILELMHPADRWQVAYSIRRMNANEDTVSCNYRIQPKNSNDYLWINLTAKKMEQADGTVLVYVTCNDITTEKNAAQALTDSQQAYSIAADAAGMAVWRYDIAKDEKTFLDNKISQLVRTKYGMSKVIKNDSQVMRQSIDPSSYEDYDHMLTQLRKGKNTSADLLLKSVKGNPPHWERLIYSVVCDDTGTPTIGYGIGMNITQNKLRSMQYEQELEQLNTVSQPNIIAKCHCDLTQSKILAYVSSSPHAMPVKPDTPYEYFLSTLLSLVINKEDKARVAHEMSKDHLLHHFVTGERTLTIEYHRLNDNMTPILVEATISIFANSAGHIECFMHAYDMTNKFMGDVISSKITDLGYTHIAMINLVTGTMTYYSRETGVVESTPQKQLFYESIILRRLTAALGEEAANEQFKNFSIENIIKQLSKKTMYDYSYDMPDKNGNRIRKRIQYCYLDKTETSLFMAVSDITQEYKLELKRLEELHHAILAAEHANESRSLFLSSISHDMRTPLNGIISFTKFALETNDNEKKQDYLQKIKNSGDLLLNLINDTLNLTRLESGKITVNIEKVSFKEMLESITTSIKAAAEERDINFNMHINMNMPAFVQTDRLKLQEICLNLLSNAVKFTHPKGNIDFKFSMLDGETIEFAGHDVPVCQIVVKDNGIGMSAAFLPKLFDAFAQEYSKEIPNPTGTGLGLSIVKKYIDLMGGTINVESQQGKGTVFTIRLPWEEAPNLAVDDNTTSLDTVDYSHLSVLLVEDNLLNQEIASMLLEDNGIKVNIANNGQECLEEFVHKPAGTYDLILMDIRMPIMNGYEAATAIRNLERADAKSIPIIAMTADAYEEDIKHCKAVGMQAHVSKPINPTVLFKEISHVCNLKK